MAFYGHIGFAAVTLEDGYKSMNLGIVDDSEALRLGMETCNRADFETACEGIDQSLSLMSMYTGLTKVLVEEGLSKNVQN